MDGGAVHGWRRRRNPPAPGGVDDRAVGLLADVVLNLGVELGGHEERVGRVATDGRALRFRLHRGARNPDQRQHGFLTGAALFTPGRLLDLFLGGFLAAALGQNLDPQADAGSHGLRHTGACGGVFGRSTPIASLATSRASCSLASRRWRSISSENARSSRGATRPLSSMTATRPATLGEAWFMSSGSSTATNPSMTGGMRRPTRNPLVATVATNSRHAMTSVLCTSGASLRGFQSPPLSPPPEPIIA